MASARVAGSAPSGAGTAPCVCSSRCGADSTCVAGLPPTAVASSPLGSVAAGAPSARASASAAVAAASCMAMAPAAAALAAAAASKTCRSITAISAAALAATCASAASAAAACAAAAAAAALARGGSVGQHIHRRRSSSSSLGPRWKCGPARPRAQEQPDEDLGPRAGAILTVHAPVACSPAPAPLNGRNARWTPPRCSAFRDNFL
mmetsp:Transcript_23829/g.70713  ORF Transcript_23829/g.70713 Transcript_23829/m.70713 type:complete len:206 (+) Transcript_23829:799-1416(+)